MNKIIKYFKQNISAFQRRDELHHQIFDEHVDNYTGEVHDIMDIIVDVMENGYNTSHLQDNAEQQKDLKNLFMTFTCLFMAGMVLNIKNRCGMIVHETAIHQKPVKIKIL